jgi:hypothetical protein
VGDNEKDREEPEIVDAVIVDEEEEAKRDQEKAKPRPPLSAGTVMVPCHHGCTCGLHQQTVYGDLVDEHKKTILDNGEMGELAQAVYDTTRMLNSFHNRFVELRGTTIRTHHRAQRALRDLTTSLTGAEFRKARVELDRIEATYADLSPDERHPAPWWLYTLWILSMLFMAAFDAYFFQQTFLNILGVSPNDPIWKRDIGLVVALVLAIGMIATGRILAGPVWRLRHSWRRPYGPDEPPLRRRHRWGRIGGLLATPAAMFGILAWWAQYRGTVAMEDQVNAQNGTNFQVIAPPIGVALLLLSLALTVVVLEVLVYNPYCAQRKRAEKQLAKAREGGTVIFEAAAKAVEEHEIAWGNLRSARDEVISFAHAELVRPWREVILPSRLRHGKAGPDAIEAKYGAKIEVIPDETSADGVNRLAEVRITYQLFEDITQPQPGPGPLAEVVRAVLDLDPKALKEELDRLDRQLHGDPAEANSSGPSPAEPDHAAAQS